MSKRKMKDTPPDDVALDAVHEAEFLAKVLEHPDTPPHVRGAIRFLMIGAVGKLRGYLQHHKTDGEMVRDIYPYGRLACVGPMGNAFQIVFDEIRREAPDVVNEIQEQANREGAVGLAAS
jgi:hypothetical protein